MFRAYGSFPSNEPIPTNMNAAGTLPTWTPPNNHVEMTRHERFYDPATLDSANILVENIFKSNNLKGKYYHRSNF
jgi:hypothetical protein